MIRKFLVFMLLGLVGAAFHSAWALTSQAQKLVEFETKANAAGERDSNMIPLFHLEIPAEILSYNIAGRIDFKLKKALIFERDGKTYVRWVLNPEDTRWGQEVMDFLKSKNLDATPRSYFKGYQTASRSYIAEDPVSGVQFSVKSSTDKTGGFWKDKKQPVGEAIDSRLISDFLNEQNKKRPFRNFVFMDEPAIFAVPELDQAVVIRDIEALRGGPSKFIYVPGFSVLHQKTGIEIAAKNGVSDPYEFWTEHYINPVGRALGELAGRTGLQFDSPHSQNFLVELDLNYKPTGRIVLRDMADLYLDKNFILTVLPKNGPLFLDRFTQKKNILNVIAAGFGPLHGNQSPTWVDAGRYNYWKVMFFHHFEQSFKETTGFDLGKLKVDKSINGRYFQAAYDLRTIAEMVPIFEATSKLGFVPVPKLSCQEYFGAPQASNQN